MPTCPAIYCRSGYKSKGKTVPCPERITWHKFPLKNPIMLRKWMKNLSRGNDFSPKPGSRICSLHFKKEDFIVISQDERTGRSDRKWKGPELEKRRLKPTAYPTVFKSVPMSALRKKTPEKRKSSSKTTVTARRLFDASQQDMAEERFWETDTLKSLDDLEQRLKTEMTVPGGFCCTR